MTATTAPHRTRVLEALYRAADEINLQQDDDKHLEKSEQTVLFGQDGVLDSLGLVSLIVAAEQALEDTFGVALTLADDRAMAQERNPFQTLGTLADYVTGLIDEANADG